MIPPPGRRTGSASFEFLRLILIAVFLLLAATALYVGTQLREQDRLCQTNLRQIYGALDRYENEWGRLPGLAFFPDQPDESLDSLLTVLRRFGVTDMHCVCPALPDTIRHFGITYVWNVGLNGRQISRIEEPVWMLVEVSALNPVLPAPHAGRYHVLYTDGRVEAQSRPPPGL